MMTATLDEFNDRIHDLVERENECEDLFKTILNGNGENSVRYFAMRDACKELRNGIFKSAKSAGLTREHIKIKIENARSNTIVADAKETRKK